MPFAHGSYPAADASVPLSLYATLGWRHGFGDLMTQAQQRFADGERFALSGVSLRAHAALVQLGIDAAAHQPACRLRRLLAGHASDQAVRMTLQVTF